MFIIQILGSLFIATFCLTLALREHLSYTQEGYAAMAIILLGGTTLISAVWMLP